MASYLNPDVLDEGLDICDTLGDQIYITSALAVTYTEATATYDLGSKTTGVTVSAPANKAGGGREVTISAFTDGVVGTSGTATHWALVDSTNSRLLACQTLTASQAVTAPNAFELDALTIGIPNPADMA